MAIRDMDFEAIYSLFNRIDEKQLQMINGEVLAHFMTKETRQSYTER